MADVKSFFGEYLPNKLTENPDLCSEVNAVYQFDIDGAGTWTVDLTNGGAVTDGPHDDPGCVVSCAEEDFGQLLDNPAAGMMLFTMGKLRVTNVGLAMSLSKILG